MFWARAAGRYGLQPVHQPANHPAFRPWGRAFANLVARGRRHLRPVQNSIAQLNTIEPCLDSRNRVVGTIALPFVIPRLTRISRPTRAGRWFLLKRTTPHLTEAPAPDRKIRENRRGCTRRPWGNLSLYGCEFSPFSVESRLRTTSPVGVSPPRVHRAAEKL